MLMQAFATAAAKPEGPKSDDLLEKIYAEQPRLRALPAYFPGRGPWSADDGTGKGVEGHRQGNCSYTIFIGDEVFKGPSHTGAVYSFSDEFELLQQLGGADLPIPRVTCVGQDTAFYGMTRLPGVQLSRDFMDTWAPDEINQLAKDMAAFIVGMAEALPEQAGGRKLIHDDLQAKNILIDPETRRLSGIIDFGICDYSRQPPRLARLGEGFQEMVHGDERLRETFGLDASTVATPRAATGRPAPGVWA